MNGSWLRRPVLSAASSSRLSEEMDDLPGDVTMNVLMCLCGTTDGVALETFTVDASAMRGSNRGLEKLVSSGFLWLHVPPEQVGQLSRFPNLRYVHVEMGTPIVERELLETGGVDVSLRASPWLKPRNPLFHPLLGPPAAGGFQSLCALDVSHSLDLDDASVSAILKKCTRLRELRMTGCPGVVDPCFSAAPNLELLDVDGCYRLNLKDLEESFGGPTSIKVDVLAAPLKVNDVVDVVILSGRHKGQWVPCSVVAVVDNEHQPPRYDVLVHPTTDFDNAVGFSGFCARNVKRTHLRVPLDRYSPNVRPLLHRPPRRPAPLTVTEWASCGGHHASTVTDLVRQELLRDPQQAAPARRTRVAVRALVTWPPEGAQVVFDISPAAS